MTKAQEVTRLLAEWHAGDEAALEQLTPLVYDELRALARRYMARERAGHTLQATAIVHEAFARLVEADVGFRNRGHFYSVAARMMRRILVDHAKHRRRQKRGGNLQRVPLKEAGELADRSEPDLLDLDRALERLGQLDSRKARIVELHYFGGLTYQETAEAVGVSAVTVHRELSMARAWLKNALEDEP